MEAGCGAGRKATTKWAESDGQWHDSSPSRVAGRRHPSAAPSARHLPIAARQGGYLGHGPREMVDSTIDRQTTTRSKRMPNHGGDFFPPCCAATGRGTMRNMVEGSDTPSRLQRAISPWSRNAKDDLGGSRADRTGENKGFPTRPAP